MPARRLGKHKAVFNAKVPHLATLALPIMPPPAVNWYAAVGANPMLLNDQLGDCVPAGALHCLQQHYTYIGKPYLPSDDEAVALYRRWAGYDPAEPATDQGTIMLSALQQWAQTGIPLPPRIGGGFDRIDAFASIEHGSLDWVKYAIWKFGGALIGIHCPEAFLEADYLLDIPNGVGPIAGGHCVYLSGYEPTALGDEFDTITWGGRFRMTARALAALMDEGYAILDRDWFNEQKLDPAGVNFAMAQEAMSQLTRIG